jgi:peptide/nickel transport system permease protein
MSLGGENGAPVASGPPRRRRYGRHLWILRRVGLGVVVLFAVSVIIFAATQALPGDAARSILGREATPEALAVVRDQLGLNRSVVGQYTDWLGGVLTLDLGESLAGGGRPVASTLGPRLVNSLVLLVIVAVIAIPLSILAGAVTAIRRDGVLDRGTLLGSLAVTAMPDFVNGLLLVVLFATTVFHVLPAVASFPPGDLPLAHPKEIALPVATLVLGMSPYLYRLMRASMIDVLESEYIDMARLKGVPERTVMLRHALPNALIPVIQGSAVMLAWLLGGIVVIEFLFAYPGMGSLLTDAVANRDVPIIQAVVLVLATGVVLFNLIADTLTILATPKLRTGFLRR